MKNVVSDSRASRLLTLLVVPSGKTLPSPGEKLSDCTTDSPFIIDSKCWVSVRHCGTVTVNCDCALSERNLEK